MIVFQNDLVCFNCYTIHIRYIPPLRYTPRHIFKNENKLKHFSIQSKNTQLIDKKQGRKTHLKHALKNRILKKIGFLIREHHDNQPTRCYALDTKTLTVSSQKQTVNMNEFCAW